MSSTAEIRLSVREFMVSYTPPECGNGGGGATTKETGHPSSMRRARGGSSHVMDAFPKGSPKRGK